MIHRLPFDFVNPLARRFPILKTRARAPHRGLIMVDAGANRPPVNKVCGFCRGIAQKFLGGRAHRDPPFEDPASAATMRDATSPSGTSTCARMLAKWMQRTARFPQSQHAVDMHQAAWVGRRDILGARSLRIRRFGFAHG